MKSRLAKYALILLLPVLASGCDRFVPANQKMMKDAIRASDQAVRSEEKTWAMLLRIEELSQRLEQAALRAEAAAEEAERAAAEMRRVGSDLEAAETTLAQTQAAAKRAEAAAGRAAEAAGQAEDALRRMEAQEGESLQKMLQFMRELGYEP